MTTQTRCFKQALAKVRALFVATPGLTLTTADTARLSSLDRQVCRVVLRTLTEAGVLERRVAGVFVLRAPKDATKPTARLRRAAPGPIPPTWSR